MKIPPLFEQLYQWHKELTKEIKWMHVVLFPENYAGENRQGVKKVEKILHEMLNLIEEIKKSQT